MASTKVAFLTIVRGTFDANYGQVVREQILKALSTEVDVVDYPEPLASAADAAAAIRTLPLQDIGAVVVLQATFADGSIITEIAQATQRSVVVWGIPEPPAEPGSVPRLALNSLCGINLAAHALKRIGATYSCVFGPPSPEIVNRVVAQVRAYSAVRKLRDAKVLTIGSPPQGFYPSYHTADELRQVFGIDVVNVGLDEMFTQAGAVDAEAVHHTVEHVHQNLACCAQIEAGEVEKSVRAYLAVRHLIQEQGISAVAAQCWPQFMTEYGGAACWMISRLNDDGVAAACETDVFGAITMLLQQYLTGTASYFADLVQVNEAANSAVFWHCGAAPTSLAGKGGAQAGVQPNRKVGLALNFALRAGRVTVAKIGRQGDRFTMFITTGTALDAPLRFLGNTLTLQFDAPVAKVTETIFAHGLDHHYAVAYGDIAAELRICAQALGIPVVTVGESGEVEVVESATTVLADA